MHARVLAESLMHYRESLLFSRINRKRLCQTLSSVDSSIIIHLFGCLVLLGLTKKSTKHMGGLYVYVIMVTSWVMANF